MNQETVRKNPHPEMHERATKPYRTDWVCPLAWGHEKPRVFQSSIARGRNFYPRLSWLASWPWPSFSPLSLEDAISTCRAPGGLAEGEIVSVLYRSRTQFLLAMLSTGTASASGFQSSIARGRNFYWIAPPEHGTGIAVSVLYRSRTQFLLEKRRKRILESFPRFSPLSLEDAISTGCAGAGFCAGGCFSPLSLEDAIST